MPQFSSRPPFSGDPLPFRYTVATATGVVEVRSSTDPFGNREYRPRPNLVLPQTNSTNIVLTHARDCWAARGDKVLAWQVKRYLDEVDIDALGAPAEHAAHARTVLTRLAALAPAGGTLDLRQDRPPRPSSPPALVAPTLTVQRDDTHPYANFVITVMGVIALGQAVAAAVLLLPRIIGG